MLIYIYVCVCVYGCEFLEKSLASSTSLKLICICIHIVFSSICLVCCLSKTSLSSNVIGIGIGIPHWELFFFWPKSVIIWLLI